VANTTGIKAGRAYVELGVGDKLTAGLRRAQARLRAFGAGVTRWGTRVFAVGTALAAPAVVAAKSFAKMGDQVAKMAKRTGLSVETLSELKFVASQTGTEFASLEMAFRKMQRSIYDAGRGLSTQTDALADLGLRFEDLDGLSPEQQFKLLAEAISRIEDPTRRAGIAMTLFGRTGTNLLPMFAHGAAGIEKLQAEARRLGLTMSGKDAKAAEDLTDAFDKLWKVLKMVVFQVGAALAPALTEVGERMASWASAAISWIGQNRGLIVSLAQLAAGVVAAGAALIATGKAITLFSSLIGVASTVLGALLSPIGVVITAVGALGAYLLTSTEAGGKALDWLGGKFATLKDDALAAYQGIGDALAAGDLGLAAKILWLTLKVQWKRGVQALLDVWLGFKHGFLKLVYGTWYGALALGELIWHGLEIGWIETTSFLSKTWSRFVGFFKRTWHQLSAAAQKAWTWIKSLFDDSVNVDAEYAQIDKAKDAAIARIDSDQARAIAQREKQRQQKREGEERRHQARMLEIGQAHQRKRDEMADEYRDRMKAAEDELAAARDEWKAALADARTKRQAKEDADSGPGKLEGPDDLLNRIRAAAGGLGDQLKRSVRGTFNAAAGLSGFGAGSAMERTAVASEGTEKNTRKMRELLEDFGGSSFV